MKSQMGGLRRKFMGNHLITTQYTSSQISSEEKEQNIIEWVTFFRRNWHIYVDMILGIKLRPFQMVMIYLMGISSVFFAICSRGLSKTFIVGLGSIVKMNLYPYSEIVITSSTIAQANKMVEDKIRDEIIKKLSDYLLYMYEKEYLVITKPDDGYKIENKLNREFNREEKLDVVVSDLTYVNVKGKWNYICLIIDLFNREIIGYAAGKHKTADLVYKAFSKIKYNLNNINIFHTDRGNEFKNKIIEEVLKTFKIERSLSKKGCPYDNAVAEATYKIIKTEFAFNRIFESFEELETELFDYINWYNNIRIHSSLNYLTPIEYKKVSL